MALADNILSLWLVEVSGLLIYSKLFHRIDIKMLAQAEVCKQWLLCGLKIANGEL